MDNIEGLASQKEISTNYLLGKSDVIFVFIVIIDKIYWTNQIQGKNNEHY